MQRVKAAITGRKARRPNQAEVDRQTCSLTGDPTGLIVALHTACFLNGLEPHQRGVLGPASSKRITDLTSPEAQRWYRAPYAQRPVASIVPVVLTEQPLTLPFEQQMPPEPLPGAPYWREQELQRDRKR